MIKEIYSGVYVGTLEDYAAIAENPDYFTVIAAKEPLHRQAVGYTGRGCPKDSPEYLYAKRKYCLICNLVDVDNPEWISPIIIDKALEDIQTARTCGKLVLICCNQGHSRSAVIGMLYMHMVGLLSEPDFEKAEAEYLKIYPDYAPANGMREYARQNWGRYAHDKSEK